MQIIQRAARPNRMMGSQGPVSGASRDPHLAGRDPHPLGRQPGHQGEWALAKETSHTQRLQPVH